MEYEKMFENISKEDIPQVIGNYLEEKLKEQRITNLIQGREIALNEILGMFKSKKKASEIRAYLEKCLTEQSKETFEKIIRRK